MQRVHPIALLAGGASPEHEISLRTGFAMQRAALARGLSVLPVLIGRSGRWNLLAGPQDAFPAQVADSLPFAQHSLPAAEAVAVLRGLGVRTALLALHGTGGEDGSMQGFLMQCGLAFTGSGMRASALAIDKHRTKILLAAAGIPVPRGFLRDPADGPLRLEDTVARAAEIASDFVVKTNDSGSSYGVSLVQGMEELRRELLRREAEATLIEERIFGQEFTVPVLGHGAKARALPVVLIRPKEGAFFDTTSKYAVMGAEEIAPAPIPADLTVALQDLCCRAHRAIGARGISRTDVLVDPKRGPIVLEVNTLPGMTEQSLVPKSAAAAGLSLEDLIAALLDDAEAARGAP